MEDRCEIRLLGSLQVRRRDGSVVDAREWRTRKTRALLRLLALHAGEPLPVELIASILWSDVDVAKARASLRTAASHIRQVLRDDTPRRSGDGLVLETVWVDALAFEALATEARRLIARGDRVEGVRLAEQALALYGGDLDLESLEDERSVRERERLRLLDLRLLIEGAEAALAGGRPRLAREWAGVAASVDPFAERAHRALIRAHARLGDSGTALRAYEHCRVLLADELGADPSQETRTLHLELLQGREGPGELPFVGRGAELRALRSAVASALRERAATLLVVAGPPGAGKSRLVREACREWRPRVVALEPAGDPLPAGEELVVVGEGVDEPRLERLAVALADRARSPRAVVVTMTTSGDGSAERRLSELEDRGGADVLRLLPMSGQDASRLLSAALGEAVDPALVARLRRETGSWPGSLISAARALDVAAEGVSTPHGLSLPRAGEAGEPSAEQLVGRTRAALRANEQEVLDHAVVLDRDLSDEALARLLPGAALQDIRSALSALEDAGIVRRTAAGFEFVSSGLRRALYAWLRPSRRRRLHEGAAVLPTVPPERRADHWLAAGERRLACAAMLEAAREALDGNDFERAGDFLERLAPLVDASSMAMVDRIELLEARAQAARGGGHLDDARVTLDEALELAMDSASQALPRLLRARGDLELGMSAVSSEASIWYKRALACESASVLEQSRSTAGVGLTLAMRAPADAEPVLREAVTLSDASRDAAMRVKARTWLAVSALAPQRRLPAAGAVGAEALAVAEESRDPGLLAKALLRAHEPLLWTGQAGSAVSALERALHLADRAQLAPLGKDIELSLALAYHDAGAAAFEALWARTWPREDRWRRERAWRWPAVRILLERGELRAAESQAAYSLGSDEGTVGFQLTRMAAAEVEAALGRPHQAVALLAQALERARTSRAELLVPQIAARLAALEAATDPAAAGSHLRIAEVALKGSVNPRERCLLLRARAEAAAAMGAPLAAANLAAAAVRTVSDAGHVFDRVEAALQQEGHLRAAGRPEDAAAVRSAVDGWLWAAGARARMRSLPHAAPPPSRVRASGRGR